MPVPIRGRGCTNISAGWTELILPGNFQMTPEPTQDTIPGKAPTSQENEDCSNTEANLSTNDATPAVADSYSLIFFPSPSLKK